MAKKTREIELTETIEKLSRELSLMQKKPKNGKKEKTPTENLLNILNDVGRIASRLKTLIIIKKKYMR